MTITHLLPQQYTVSTWSGGKTIQLAIAPDGALYADRSFAWRISSATVDLPESDFTALPDYLRVITPIAGDMILSHNGGPEKAVLPGQIHRFDGADATHARGCCTDFNLMLRKGLCQGGMQRIELLPGETASLTVPAGGTLLLYCVSGSAACPEAEGIVLQPQETLRLDSEEKQLVTMQGKGVVMAAWAAEN